MPLDAATLAGQVGAATGLWTHTPVDWRGNEPPGTARPGGWPTDASASTAVVPNGSTAGALGLIVGITAISVSGITATAATVNFTLSGPANYIVEYGTTAAYGTQVAGSGNGAQTKALGTLVTGTLYHYRIVATPGGGTATSTSDRTFTTS
jgi:hypothetical protein